MLYIVKKCSINFLIRRLEKQAWHRLEAEDQTLRRRESCLSPLDISWGNKLDSDNQWLRYPPSIFFESNVRFIPPSYLKFLYANKTIITFQIWRIKLWYWHHWEAFNEIYQMMLFFCPNSSELKSYDHFLNSPFLNLTRTKS